MRLKVPRPQLPEPFLEIPPADPAKQRAPENQILSVVDVTGQAAKIPDTQISNGLIKDRPGVPYWQHQYVYSATEIQTATAAQKEFYKQFYLAFRRGEHLDLEGNTNYAFVLLYDLAGSYNHPGDLARIEHQYERLGEFYPKTRAYIRGALYDRMLEISDHVGIAKYQPAYDYRTNWEDQWQLGNKHKKRLRLSPDEVKLLNRIPYQRNNFLDIQFCGDEVMRLYLRVAAKLESQFIKDGIEFEKQLNEVYDIIARKHFRYRNGSANYKETIETGESDLLDFLFRYCENAVRDAFSHKRKRNLDLYYQGEAREVFETRLIARAIPLIEDELSRVNRPNRETETVLNAQNPTRWKTKLDEMKVEPTDNFVTQVVELEKLNERNPSKENIYFEASKFIAKRDKNAALELFIRYVDCDLRSDKFDNKKLTKTVQKSLFANEQQIRDFEKLIGELVRSKDLSAALAAVKELYAPKRKRIRLSSDAIHNARAKHSDTVDLLNEYLQDENESDVGPAAEREIKLEIPGLPDGSTEDARETAVELKQVQVELLEMFERSGLVVTHADVEAFAAERGLFKNQLIESINETCFELLDDVLIEEDESAFTVDAVYFGKIFSE